MLCIVIRSKGRTRHWHWPKAGIISCENSKPDQEEDSE